MMQKSKAYMLGFLAGLLLVGAIAAAIALLVKKLGYNKREYDERQKLAQGTAYKYAFFTSLGYGCLVGLFDLFTGIRWCDTMTCMMLGVCVSTLVFALICIWRDAYMSFKQPKRTVYLIMAMLALSNLGIGCMNLVTGDFIENGMLTFHCVNFVVGAMLLIIILTMALKGAIDRRRENDGRVEE